MNATDAIFTLVIAALIALLGVLLFTGHATGLIAGYNTLPEEERARYDKRALGRFMGRVMFVVAGCLCACSPPATSGRETGCSASV